MNIENIDVHLSIFVWFTCLLFLFFPFWYRSVTFHASFIFFPTTFESLRQILRQNTVHSKVVKQSNTVGVGRSGLVHIYNYNEHFYNKSQAKGLSNLRFLIVEIENDETLMKIIYNISTLTFQLIFQYCSQKLVDIHLSIINIFISTQNNNFMFFLSQLLIIKKK